MDFWFYGNLTGNIRYLTRFGKPDIFGNKPVQQTKKDRKLSEPVDYINHLQFQVQLPLWTSPNKPGSTITNGAKNPCYHNGGVHQVALCTCLLSRLKDQLCQRVAKWQKKFPIKRQTIFTFANGYFFANLKFCHNMRNGFCSGMKVPFCLSR